MGCVSVPEMNFQVVALARWGVNKSILLRTCILKLLLPVMKQTRERPAYLCILAFLIDSLCLCKIIYTVISGGH